MHLVSAKKLHKVHVLSKETKINFYAFKYCHNINSVIFDNGFKSTQLESVATKALNRRVSTPLHYVFQKLYEDQIEHAGRVKISISETKLTETDSFINFDVEFYENNTLCSDSYSVPDVKKH